MKTQNDLQIPFSDITVLVLSGGKSRRMSGIDKGLIKLNGKPMIKHTLDQLSGHFDDILISANRNIDQYSSLGFPVIPDELPDRGPLGGILSAINRTDRNYLLVTPCDTPMVSMEISRRLIDSAGRSAARIQVADDGTRLQMLHALFNLSSGKLKQSLKNYLKSDRKVQIWYEQNSFFPVDCSDIAQDFININTPESIIKITDKSSHS